MHRKLCTLHNVSIFALVVHYSQITQSAEELDDEKIGPTFTDGHNLMRLESDANMEWETERQLEISDEMQAQMAYLKAQGNEMESQQVITHLCHSDFLIFVHRLQKVRKKWTMRRSVLHSQMHRQ